MDTRYKTFNDSLGTRNTKKEKNKFCLFLETYSKEFNLNFELQEEKNNKMTTQNIVVGNLSKSEIVVVCPYETSDLVLGKKARLYLDDPEFNLKVMKTNTFKTLLFTIILISLSISLILFGIKQPTPLLYIVVVTGFLVGASTLWLNKGIAVKNNVVLNSSVYMMLELISTFKSDRISYVFLDNTLYSDYGFAVFLENNNVKKKMIINLGDMSCGEELIIRKHLKSRYKNVDELISDSAIISKEKNKFITDSVGSYLYMSQCGHDLKGYYIDGISYNSDFEFNETKFRERKLDLINMIGGTL